jgi:hypothetical protein
MTTTTKTEVAVLKESKRLKFVTAALVKNRVFWDLTLYPCVSGFRRFEKS